MEVTKIEKTKNMSNFYLNDKNLSLKAKGLLSVMLSLPNDWDYSLIRLKSICNESVNTINNIIHELEKNNYLTRKRIYQKGKISSWQYLIYTEKNTRSKK